MPPSPAALPPHLESLASALSAAAGALLSTTSLYPLEMLKAQLAMAPEGKGVASIVSDLGGPLGLYTGVGYKAFQVVLAKFLYYYAHAALSVKGASTAGQLAVGYISDWAAVPITLPIEATITKIQAASRAGGDSGMLAILRATAAGPGLLSLYGGLRWQALVALMPAIQQTVFDSMRLPLLHGRDALDAREAFALGAVARMFALLFVFPFMRIKTMVQAGAQASPIALIRAEGVGALYRGFPPEAVRGVLSAALMLMVKERLAGRSRALVRQLTGKSEPPSPPGDGR